MNFIIFIRNIASKVLSTIYSFKMLKYTRTTFLLIAFSSSIAYAAKCSDYNTCEEAVIAWCSGEHPRADGDNDGVPCENVCTSVEEVQKIKAKIKC